MELKFFGNSFENVLQIFLEQVVNHSKIKISSLGNIQTQICVFLRPKVAKISEMVWAQHIMMNYAQKLQKVPSKGQNDSHKNFTVLQKQGFAAISCNLLKITILRIFWHLGY